MTDPKDVLEAAAERAESVVALAADRAAFMLAQHAEEKTESIAERAAEKAIDGFFMRLGVDTADPIAMQKDFAHLRSWRESTDDIKKKALLTSVGIVVTGAIGYVLFLFGGNAH